MVSFKLEKSSEFLYSAQFKTNPKSFVNSSLFTDPFIYIFYFNIHISISFIKTLYNKYPKVYKSFINVEKLKNQNKSQIYLSRCSCDCSEPPKSYRNEVHFILILEPQTFTISIHPLI